MATTQFFMTMDGTNTSYPEDGGESGVQTAIGRYTSANLTNERLVFPQQTDSFNTPYVKFYFLDAYGSPIRIAPVVSLRMPSVFNISNFSDYSRTDQIMNSADAFKKLGASGKTGLEALMDSASQTVINMAEAINYSLLKGGGAAVGFTESAGLSGISQYEFSSRQATNPMAQLLYKGPQYRKYQIPVPMKPRNKAETAIVQKIIKAFRVASAPSYSKANDGILGSALGSETAFTFGYPHLVAFNIEFYSSKDSAIKVLYKSKACALESVAVDYGGQKLAFFEDGVPTEMNLTLQLSEITARTLSDEQRAGQNADFTIF
jgi:hypothetical protein